MKVKIGHNTHRIDEELIVREFVNFLYERNTIKINSVNKAITVNILEKALVNSKSREVKKQISELIIALSTADNVKFIKEDINE